MRPQNVVELHIRRLNSTLVPKVADDAIYALGKRAAEVFVIGAGWMQSDSSISRVKATFENWAMYEAVIRHNYMFHNQLVAALKTIAAEISGSLRIVDLGCGDSWLAAHAFRDSQVESYFGVDLSESAIERAKSNVASWASRACLSCDNIAECVAMLPENSANLILASNSLHHFEGHGKIAILQTCFRILKPGGVLCWIDPARNDGESREEFLARLTNVMQHEWIGLSQDQRDRATQHVWSSDYPETERWMRKNTEEAGFKLARAPRPFSLHTSRHLMRLLAKSDDQWRKYLFY
jgi:SAM-dependent methyltransferase